MNIKTKKLIIGSIVGALLLFFIPAFPVPILDRNSGNYVPFWNSGLMQIGLSNLSLILIEIIGAALGFLFTFIYIKKKG